MVRLRFADGGYTLIEMLLVLTIVSLVLLLVPYHQTQSKAVLHSDMETLRHRLVQAQSEAITSHRDIFFHSDGAIYLQDTRILPHSRLSCGKQSFHFTPQGNVSKACTLHCQLDGAKASLIIELGSGRMYVQ